MRIIFEFLLCAIAIGLAAFLTPGVQIDGLFSAIIVAIVFAGITIAIGILARKLDVNLFFLSSGILSFIMSAILITFIGDIINGFEVSGFIPALIFSLILALIRSLFGITQPK